MRVEKIQCKRILICIEKCIWKMRKKLASWHETLIVNVFKGGLMSSFLMCVHDPSTKSWLTVTKVSNGFTDAELAQINKNLKMKKISRDSSQVSFTAYC